MNQFNEVRHRIASKNKGASFYRGDLHIPVSVIAEATDPIGVPFHESGLNIAGLVSENMKELEISMKLVEKLHIQGTHIYPLLGFWLEIPWPSENIGILVLYEAAHSDYKIKKLLEHLGYDEKKKQVTSDVSIRKMVELIHSDDGLAFYSPKNSADILGLYKNKRLFLSLKEDGYDGIETNDKKVPAQIAAEMRESGKPNLPIFISSRARSIEELGNQYTLLKAPEPGYSGIKGAMKDAASRIRYPGDLTAGFHRVIGMEVEGQFFENEVFHFNPNLNCVLGGKGTGKTAIIELLRFAFNLSAPEDIKNYYLRNENEFLTFLLGEGSIRVWIENNKGRSFLITRSLMDEESRIFTQSGEEITADITAGGMFSLDILGWSEIEYRAQNPQELLKMLDLSREETRNLNHEIKAVKNQILILGEKLVVVRQQGAQNLQRLKELLGKKEELESLKKTEFSQLVENYEVRYKREFFLDKHLEMLNQFEDSCLAYFQKDTFEQFEKQFPRITSQYIPEINQLLSEIKDHLGQNMRSMKEHVDLFHEALNQSRERSLEQKRRLQQLNEKEKSIISREKKKYGKEIQKVMSSLSDLAREVNNIPDTKQKQLEIQEEYVNLRQEVSKKVTHLKHLLNEQKILREDIQGFINQELAPDIQMEFVPYSQTPQIKEFLGSLCESLDNSRLQMKLQKVLEYLGEDLINLLDFNWINEEENLASALQLNPRENKQFRVFLLKNYGEILRLAKLNIDAMPELLFRKKPVHQLSSGQRCTTVLPVLFLLGNHPLIIDQPEDNLDNAYIFNQIVQPIRKKLKGQRQLILVTHNPNIPVSGDAEKIFLMEADDSHGWVKEGGYLDEGKMPVEIQKILEGGKEAFGLRMQKYGY